MPRLRDCALPRHFDHVAPAPTLSFLPRLSTTFRVHACARSRGLMAYCPRAQPRLPHKAPTPWVLRSWLTQLRWRARRWRCLRRGQVRHSHARLCQPSCQAVRHDCWTCSDSICTPLPTSTRARARKHVHGDSFYPMDLKDTLIRPSNQVMLKPFLGLPQLNRI